MAKSADIGSKRLISLAPTAWVRWLIEDASVVALEILSGDFQWVERATNALIKVRTASRQEFLIANEIQLRPDKNMARRMSAYAALAREKYSLPVYPVLINILPPPQTHTIETSFHAEFMGLVAHQDFRVINLWEVDASIVFQQNLAPLLPFVPILKHGAQEQQIQRAVYALRRTEEIAELESLLAFFASFVLESATVQRIMRWDMIVLHESPWYNEILQEGIQLGIEQGIEQGETRVILRLLQHRFGDLHPNFVGRIQRLNAEQIEKLLDVVIDAETMDPVLSFLDDHSADED